MTDLLNVKFITGKRSNTKKKKKKKTRQKDGECRNNIFENLRGKSMVHPSILHTQAFKLFKKVQHVFVMFAGSLSGKNVIKLTVSRYTSEICNTCFTKKSEWICLSYDKYLRKKRWPQINNLQLCLRTEELDSLCLIELMLISQIIPIMFIAANVKRAQHRLKGPCVLVPAV